VTSAQAADFQDWLWSNSRNNVPLISEYSNEHKTSLLYTDNNEEVYVGALSRKFSYDLFDIAKELGGGNRRPGKTIRYIRMIGASTVVLPPAQRETLHSPYRESGFVLVPVISAFTFVYYN